MQTRKLPWLIGFLTAVILLVDLVVPKGWAVPLFYIPCVLLTYWGRQPQTAFWVAGICSALVLVGFGGAPSTIPIEMSMLNRFWAAALCWGTAWCVHLTRRNEAEGLKLREAIERQRRELETIIDSVPALIFYKDRHQRLIRVNAVVAALLGLPKEQIEGKTDLELGSPFARKYLEDDQQIIKSGIAKLGLIEQMHSQSGTRWLQTDKLPVRDQTGEIIGLLGVAVDITRFKETEERLRESESSLSRAQRIASIGSWTIDLDNPEIIERKPLRWSEQVFRIFGYEPGEVEVTSENFYKAVHPEDRPRVREAIGKALRDRTRYQIDHRIILADGTVRYVHEESDVTFDSQSGMPLRMTGTIQDITEQKWNEILLTEQRAILESIATGASLSEILTELVIFYEKQFPEAICSILMLDSQNRLRLGAAPHLPEAYNQAIDGIEIGPEVGSCGTAAYRREMVIVEDIETDPLWRTVRHVAQQFHLRACWSIPILDSDGRVLGTFAIYYQVPRRPSPRELSLIGDAVHIAGIAIQRSRSIDALQAAERLFRTVVENALVGMHIAQDWKIVFANPRLAEMLGYSPEELVALDSVLDIVVPEDREFIANHIRQRTTSEVPEAQYEFRGLRKNGEVIQVEIRGSRIELNGRPAVIGSSIDITDRKRSEAALRESEERYRALVENAPAGVFVNVGGRFAYVNDALCRLLGATGKEVLLGQPVFDRFHPDCHESIRSRIYEMVSHGGTVPLQDQRYLRLDGTVVEVQAVAATILFHGQQALLVMVNDVTERKRMERILQQTTSRLSTLLRTSQILSSSLNINALLDQLLTRLITEFAAADVAVLYEFDVDQDKLIPRSVAGVDAQLVRGVTLSASETIAGIVARGGQSVLLSTPQEIDELMDSSLPDPERHYVPQHFGRRVHSKVCVGLNSRKGEPLGVLSLSSSHSTFTPDDLSLLEAVAAQMSIALQNADLYVEVKEGRERLKGLSRQIINAQESERSHVARELHDEIGQVLTAVGFRLHGLMSFCEELADHQHRDRLRDDIDLVDRAIQQVRNLSLDLRPPTLDVLGLEATLRASLNEQAQRMGLNVQFTGHLESRLTPELEITCYRVVQTSLTNVIRHAQAQNVWVELQHHDYELLLTVRDDGVGFDVQEMMQRARQGESFGLFGVRERVELVGGQLRFESSPGHGTTVTARFPLSPNDTANPSSRE